MPTAISSASTRSCTKVSTTNLTENDLEAIFIDLTRNVSDSFITAVLHLAVYDEISGKYLRDEDYGVVYNAHTGHYDFAELFL